jgi:histidyl-tRNA synthetase
MGTRAVKGFSDILPSETKQWRFVEECAREVFERFGFLEVRIPVLEKTEVFERTIGEGTDIVNKEMYTFEDRGGNRLTLRPEATASVVRAYVEHKLYTKDPVAKLYCMGPMFRYEQPQRGRYRQFHQINVEAFGIIHPMIDAEIMAMLMAYLDRLGVSTCELQVNSLGCAACRKGYVQELQAFLTSHADELCDDCRTRMRRNPMRVFDCKVETCKAVMEQAPLMRQHLCGDCAAHFREVISLLELLRIPHIQNPRIVRGLDYYTRTTFEVVDTNLGAQNALAGGGRYDHLVEALGGPPVPGIGFAMGMERLLLLVREEPGEPGPSVFIAALGEAAQRHAFDLRYRLSRTGVVTMMDYEGRSLKAQMRRAHKFGARHVLIIGDEELEKGSVILRDMEERTQNAVPLAAAYTEVLERVRGTTPVD